MSRLEKTKHQIASLSRSEKAFLIALLLRLAYALIGGIAGTTLPGDLLIRLFFIVATIVFLIWSFPKLVRSLLWRVRHRLLVTWIFVGVVPIVLICMLVGQGLYFLMGQVVGYMTTNEISRHGELVQSTATALGWSLSHRPTSVSAPTVAETYVRELSAAQQSEFGAVVRSGQDQFVTPGDSALREIPGWSKPDFRGLVKNGDDYYFAAHVALGEASQAMELFVYRHAAADFFKNLLPGVAVVEVNKGTATAAGIDIKITEEPRSGFSFDSKRPDDDPDLPEPEPPKGRGWWDIPVNWIVVTPTTDLATGMPDQSLAIVSSRVSLVLKRLFSSLGNIAPVVVLFMIITACALLVVEIVSVLFGAKLTRSITRSVADLYEGTRKIQAGDFSHRIPVRKTKDQLSELAGSFNSMTARIENLIEEVKEKERLENELEIARDVQSQLFPKEVPRLKTLELWGGCQPARTVSGDYYDFLSLGADRTALAIGDISGKGISAALLMAHIQSALRSQFTHRGNGTRGSSGSELTSPSMVLSILNDHLYMSSPPEKYATFFLGLYTDEGGQLIYTNAGHLAPMLVRRGAVTRLAGDGFPVGMFPGIQYEQQAIGLEPGDLLVGFTDGVTETPNRDGEEFGDRRLTELLVRLVEKPLDRIASEINESVGAWAGDVERHDDTTLLLARRV
jgi:phosphoserine phosphatase RsbU/P